MKANLESISERNGIDFLSPTDKKIYSVGISTGGLAEIKMTQSDRHKHIVATTVDLAGAEYASNASENRDSQIKLMSKSKMSANLFPILPVLLP